MKKRFILLFAALLLVFACETTLGPNEIGGNSDLELTNVGNGFGLSIDLGGLSGNGHFNGNIKDSIYISENDGGIVTISGKISTDFETLHTIDSLLGTQNLPQTAKNAVIDAYRDKYNLRIDTSNHENMSISFDNKIKITSEGIQDFTYSNGDLNKPFTIVKYSSNVGDKYEFTTSNGEKIVRTVVQKNPDEDWDVAFWSVKTIRVEEVVADDPLVQKITYICNHKFGLVGLIVNLKDGRIISTVVFPPTLK